MFNLGAGPIRIDGGASRAEEVQLISNSGYLAMTQTRGRWSNEEDGVSLGPFTLTFAESIEGNQHGFVDPFQDPVVQKGSGD